ncbi:MAG: phosphotransferase family protein [Acidimicrobiia bacterium]
MTTSPRGIDLDALLPWFEAHAPAVTAPLAATLIAGGRSNLTYRIADATGRAWALRRPPLGHILPSAHDVAREHRVISALASSNVPVPPTIGACTDDTVIGAPFYVMDFVEGTVVDEPEAAEPLSMEARHESGLSLARVLGDLHAVDVASVGLDTLARPDAYVARQLKRWLDQYFRGRTREIDDIETVHGLLSARIPEQQSVSLVHGDYRLGNVIVDDDGQVRAVLDWELCTLGDPLADVGYLMMAWPQNEREAVALPAGNTAPGFASRDDVLAAYADASGRDVSDIGFYVALSYWRLACIVEGVYARTLAGQQGDKQIDLDHLSRRPPLLAALALEALG